MVQYHEWYSTNFGTVPISVQYEKWYSPDFGTVPILGLYHFRDSFPRCVCREDMRERRRGAARMPWQFPSEFSTMPLRGRLL